MRSRRSIPEESRRDSASTAAKSPTWLYSEGRQCPLFDFARAHNRLLNAVIRTDVRAGNTGRNGFNGCIRGFLQLLLHTSTIGLYNQVKVHIHVNQ